MAGFHRLRPHCALFHQLLHVDAVGRPPVVAAVIALIGYAHFVAPQCINTIVGAVVGTISAVLVFALAECAISGTKPSGN